MCLVIGRPLQTVSQDEVGGRLSRLIVLNDTRI
jgi:hypothetical protein